MYRHKKIIPFFLWGIFYLSGPVALLHMDFYQWRDGIHTLWADYTYIYLIGLILLTIECFLTKKSEAILPFFIGIVLISYWYSSGPAKISALGFVSHIQPEKEYIKNRCHPFEFMQDGKKFLLGFCDAETDSSGNLDSLLVYDTSGDIENDQYEKGLYHRLDRKEWVNAIRKFCKSDPYQLFERQPFYTDKIYGDFYNVSFGDFGNQGFTGEYGPPPDDPECLQP